MPFDIEMTGAQDYQRTIKMAVCGNPGTGKTLFASTAPQGFYVFFRDQPRIMSIADRYMPHTKLINKFDSQGRLLVPVWDTLHEVISYLESDRGKDFRTIIIDTGDELFQAIKEGRKAANRGKFAIQDWGWLGDMYREVINRIIDMPKHVIVNFHLKASQEGEEGEIVREIALQGQAKDEVAGWFDIVGVLDSWEEDTEAGKILHRGMLTHTTPKYGFAKDHSGKLPKVFELSENFVGDFTRIETMIFSEPPTADHEKLATITVEAPPPPPATKTTAEAGVPTPEDLSQKKGSRAKPAKVEEPAEEPAETAPIAAESPAEPAETDEGGTEPVESDVVPGAVAPTTSDPEVVASPEVTGAADTEVVEPAPEPEPEVEEVPVEPAAVVAAAVETVMEAFPGSAWEGASCDVETDGQVCGKPLAKQLDDGSLVPDRDLMDLTMIRFRQHMCRDHFTAARKKG